MSTKHRDLKVKVKPKTDHNTAIINSETYAWPLPLKGKNQFS